ncbi:hypothetical protein GF314_04865 [bacterium]|nr:hypothetical protein [bacterium]
MRKIAIAGLVLIIAAAAQAGVISDLQQGVYEEGAPVEAIGVTVVDVTGNGAFITEVPVGPYSGCWAFLGSDHGLMPGDVINIQGIYEEYYGLTEINAADGVVEVTSSGPVPAPYSLTTAELMVDPEVFEGVSICLTDGFQITQLFDYGEWEAESVETGELVMFDDFWFDPPTEDQIGMCFNSVCGALTYSFGAYKLEVYADGITEYVDCTVATEATTLTEIKALF